MMFYFISVNLLPFDLGQEHYSTLITPVGARSPLCTHIHAAHSLTLFLLTREEKD